MASIPNPRIYTNAGVSAFKVVTQMVRALGTKAIPLSQRCCPSPVIVV